MLLTIENYKKSYGDKLIFENLMLNVEERDKIGIVGVNGTGKSTLLSAIAGIVPVDDGTLISARGLRISYLPQDKTFNPQNTIITEVFHGDTQLMQALRTFEMVLDENENDSATKARMEKASMVIDAENGWQLEAEAKAILTKLGLLDFKAPVGTLSGGEQKRLALATALIQPADLLLLDEPTNHLDSETITWLEDYLKSLPVAILLVTHDRYFLDHMTSKIFEIDHGKSYTYTGNYSSYLEQKTLRIEREVASEKKRQNFLRTELEWIRRGAQARSTKQQARIARYEKVKTQAAPFKREELSIDLSSSRLGRKIIELTDVTFAWKDSAPLVKHFTYTVLRCDRIGILGKNGIGKSTFLSVLAGVLAPTIGKVEHGQTVKIGYLTQQIPPMDSRLKAVDYVQEIAHHVTLKDGTTLSATQLMERFLFPSHLQWTSVANLSGGEKRRIFLLRLLMQAPNVLLLDEPTNALDLDTLAVLENFLENFSGAVIFVSHDRFFVDRIAEKVFVLDGAGTVAMHPGGYTNYQARKIQEEQIPPPSPIPPTKKLPQKTEHNEKKKLSFKETREFEEIEAVIASKEGEILVLEKQLEQRTNYQEITQLSTELAKANQELEQLLERWAYLTEIVEQMTQKG